MIIVLRLEFLIASHAILLPFHIVTCHLKILLWYVMISLNLASVYLRVMNTLMSLQMTFFL